MDDDEPQYEWHRVLEMTHMGVNFLDEGKTATVEANRRKICLVRKKGKLLAVQNRCPHSGGSLGAGFLDERGNLVCPLHRFRFCPEDGSNPSGEGYRLTPFPVEVREDGTYIGFPLPPKKKRKSKGLFGWLLPD